MLVVSIAFTLALASAEKSPSIEYSKFGEIEIAGTTYKTDVVFENGKLRKRKKGPSRSERSKYGHTPLTPREKIPWDCKKLVIGTGFHGRLPVTDELKAEAKKRGVELIILETKDAVEYYKKNFGSGLNAIFHTTC